MNEKKILRQSFIDEAIEILQEVEADFLELEKNKNKKILISRIFRNVHNLKGSANSVENYQIGDLAHSLENLLGHLKARKGRIPKNCLDLMFKIIDRLSSMISQLSHKGKVSLDSKDLIKKVKSITGAQDIGGSTVETGKKGFVIFEESENTGDSPLTDKEKVSDLDVRLDTTSGVVGNIRVSGKKVDQIIEIAGQINILQDQISKLAKLSTDPGYIEMTNKLAKCSKALRESSLGLRMISARQMFQKIQRTCSDAGRALGKKIELEITGENIEMDKEILDRISDPLMHIVRNACDHGIETETERIASGKSPFGKISIHVRYVDNKLLVDVVDDGKGMDAEEIFRIAKGKKIIEGGENLSLEEKLQLIFIPGFSTSKTVSSVSGRGVGMDVVRTNIEQVRGHISIKTEIGAGTRIEIALPHTLAFIDGLIANCSGEKVFIPVATITEVAKYEGDSLQLEESQHSTRFESQKYKDIPVHNLSELMGWGPVNRGESLKSIALIIKILDGKYAIVVDDIESRSLLTAKSLDGVADKIVGVSGVTQSDSGTPMLIVDIVDLLRNKITKLDNKKQQESQKVVGGF